MRGLDAKHNFAIARSKHDEIKNPQSFLTVAIESAVKHIDCLMICSNNHELVLKNIINFHQQTLLSYTLKFVSVGFISKPSYLTNIVRFGRQAHARPSVYSVYDISLIAMVRMRVRARSSRTIKKTAQLR
jgi:hypothetical protein